MTTDVAGTTVRAGNYHRECMEHHLPNVKSDTAELSIFVLTEYFCLQPNDLVCDNKIE